MSEPWAECGALIKERRLRQKMTQSDLADKIAKSASLVCRIERGQRRPNLKVLHSLSQILGESVQVLQQKAGYTPEFDWLSSLVVKKRKEEDILPTATEAEKDELRKYLLYLRFRATVSQLADTDTRLAATQSSTPK